MSMSKLQLAEQIVSARHGFEYIDCLSTEVLLDRCQEIFDLKAEYSKQKLYL